MAPAHHLRSVELRRIPEAAADRFPYTVPVIRTLPVLRVDRPVTFLVGENGSGKSTLLEGIAVAAGLPAVGSMSVERDETLAAQRFLGKSLKLTWDRRAFRGFFLRAEDFFGFTKALSRERAELQARLAEIDVEFAERSEKAKGLARGPVASSLADMERRYGIDLDANSHGQSFLKLFQSRFVPGGLYLLDEPEAPLSPQSQLALIAMIRDMVAQDSQFIIATHSPILLGFPGRADLLVRPRTGRSGAVRRIGARGDHARFPEWAGAVSKTPVGRREAGFGALAQNCFTAEAQRRRERPQRIESVAQRAGMFFVEAARGATLRRNVAPQDQCFPSVGSKKSRLVAHRRPRRPFSAPLWPFSAPLRQTSFETLALLRRFGRGSFVRVLGVRQRDDRAHETEEDDRADEQAKERGSGVGAERVIFVRVIVVVVGVVCHGDG